MPHVIFLHSALTQDRIVTREPKQLRRLFRFELVDIVIAMGIAGMINAAMLIMAASTFWEQGLTEIASIEEAHRTLEPLLGSAASVIFAHLAAGLGIVLLDGRHDGRAGDHAGLHASGRSRSGCGAA